MEVAVGRVRHRLEVLQQRGAVVPGHRVRGVDDVVAVQRRDRDRGRVVQAEPRAELVQVGLDRPERLLGEADEVHLVDGEHDVRRLEDRRDVAVAPRLLDDALARVDQDHRQVGGGRARDHVPRVLDVARCVGELEAPPRRHERAVGDVDRDSLLALRAEAVGEQRQVDVVVPTPAARVLDVLQLVGEDLLRVVEQPADQRRLAVVDRARGHEPEKIGVQELLRNSQRASCPPSRPR